MSSTNSEIQGTQLKWAQRTTLKPSPSDFRTHSDLPTLPRLVRTLSDPAPVRRLGMAKNLPRTLSNGL